MVSFLDMGWLDVVKFRQILGGVCIGFTHSRIFGPSLVQVYDHRTSWSVGDNQLVHSRSARVNQLTRPCQLIPEPAMLGLLPTYQHHSAVKFFQVLYTYIVLYTSLYHVINQWQFTDGWSHFALVF